MNVYLVQKEISFDYRAFPWIKRNRGSVIQKWDVQVVVAENEENAKKKFLEKNKDTRLIGFWKWAVDGTCIVMCKEPNYKVDIHVTKLDDNINIGNYMEYMTLEDFKLLSGNKI